MPGETINTAKGGGSLLFRCWKCRGVLFEMPAGATLAVTVVVVCPGCRQPNSFAYAFPQGFLEET